MIGAYLVGRKPNVPNHSVCVECKLRGTNCVMVVDGIPCMGPVTHAGCGAICPAYVRGCYGCYGPAESVNYSALGSWWQSLGVSDADLVRAFRTFNGYAPQFIEASEAYEH